MTDKVLCCKDCNAEFIFSASEQAFYKEKGFENEPQRCARCREVRKQSKRPRSNFGSTSRFGGRPQGISMKW